MSNQNDHALVSTTFMPALTPDEADRRYKAMVTFVREQMILGKDYGEIPGTTKPTLYKPGAEKIVTFFGYQPRFVDDGTIENWNDDDPFFYYHRRAQLWRGDVLVAEASGSCNSKESRYRWRWVREIELTPFQVENKAKWMTRGGRISEFDFAIEKAETKGQYGKPQSYWQRWNDAIESGVAVKIEKKSRKGDMFPAWEMDALEYRVPNEDIFSLVNTILKMAEKRALVAVALIGCNASEFFTQDMEDLVGLDPDKEDVVLDAVFTVASEKPAASGTASPTPKAETQAPAKKVDAGTDAETAIANFTAAAKEGTVGGNDYLNLGKSLSYDNAYVMEVKADFTTETKDDKGKKVTKVEFGPAGIFLIQRYREINGEPAAAGA